MKLRVKLIIAFITMSLFTTGLTGFLMNESANRVSEDHIHELTDLSLNHVKDMTDKHFSIYEQGLTLLGKSNFLHNNMANTMYQSSVVKELEAYNNTYPDVLYTYYATVNKDFLIAPHTELPEGYNPTQRPWYTKAVESKSFNWTEVYTDAFSGESIISASMPVYDNNGELIGVIGMDLVLDPFFEELMNIKVGNTGYLTLIDSTGYTLMHPNKDLVGGQVPIESLYNFVTDGFEGFIKYEWMGNDKTAFVKHLDIANMNAVLLIDEKIDIKMGGAPIRILTLLVPLFISVSIALAGLVSRKSNHNSSISSFNGKSRAESGKRSEGNSEEKYDPFKYEGR